ncbi:amidophosphoribosyltransferase [Vibrio sp. 10N.286.49.B3]|uniref:ComF family protein n=1 Tax=Vibrio sp. 10N.286.49.B3 TaxID=1880855 RepID=UPI000C86050C|nr:ComF family protein [Vibrio sp. 10N.286.49.B3]PMH46022.1 amidophosphoribosyltransferase [Vibrio sp. 10N.286.49.B3]
MLSDWLKKTMPSPHLSLCHLCRLPIEQPWLTDLWCAHCYGYFQPTPRCQRCGAKSSYRVEQCQQCLDDPPPWQRLVCIGDYQFPVANYVHQLKYERQFWYAQNLALLLSPYINQPAPILTGVPMHWQRYLKRGFNQSELLAAHLAKQLNTTHQPSLFRRTVATRSQQGLSQQQRINNLNNVFTLRHKPKVKHVAIVDDVVTTGTTVRHLCKLLLEVGVKRIDIYCVCRTPEPSS